MFFINYLLCSLVLFELAIVSGLECYVCKDQDGNHGKCLHTIQTCNATDDMCMTQIRWGTTPYWQAGAEKQYYISKMCATKQQCEKTMRKTIQYCTHVWYEDWRCSECCGGDRCNYFIISGSLTNTPRLFNIGTTSLICLSLWGFFYRA